jgi:hypothetical protein
MPNKTTKKDFAFFKKECKHWLKIFGLKEWATCYSHNPCNEDDLSWTIISRGDSKNVTFGLAPVWPEGSPVTSSELKWSAFHEVMHLLMADYDRLATSRFDVPEERLAAAEHEIIMRLGNAFGVIE